MADKPIQEGYEVFMGDGERPFGAVRRIGPGGRQEFVIYVENAGEFAVKLEAVKSVHEKKVILYRGKLDPALKRAIEHAHDAEDPTI